MYQGHLDAAVYGNWCGDSQIKWKRKEIKHSDHLHKAVALKLKPAFLFKLRLSLYNNYITPQRQTSPFSVSKRKNLYSEYSLVPICVNEGSGRSRLGKNLAFDIVLVKFLLQTCNHFLNLPLAIPTFTIIPSNANQPSSSSRKDCVENKRSSI